MQAGIACNASHIVRARVLAKLQSGDPAMRLGYTRRFVAKVVVAPTGITSSSPTKSLPCASLSARSGVGPRDADVTARLAAQRIRRADLEQEILLVERPLSGAERRVAPEAVACLGEVIAPKLGSDEPILAG